MENQSLEFSNQLIMDSFVIAPGGKYPVFIFGVVVYLFGMLCNLTLLFLIILKKNLHKPVYFILFSLPLNDLIGITTMLPKILSDIITDTSNVYYPLWLFCSTCTVVEFCLFLQRCLSIVTLPSACRYATAP